MFDTTLATGRRLDSALFETALAVDAQRGLRSRLQPLGGNLAAALLAHTIGALFARAHRGFNLLGLAVQQLLSGQLQLALVGEVGDVRGMLADQADLARDVSLVAAQRRVMFGLAQLLEIFSSAGQRIIGLVIR